MKKISSILIANRGEIAIRIANTAHKMGIEVYGLMTHYEPNAVYLMHMDHVVDVTGHSHENIFMNPDKIAEIAKENGVSSVHPGYGFLSESRELAEACDKEGVILIGPSAQAIEDMGDKGVARKMAKAAGVPILEGSKDIVENIEDAKVLADNIGYPVIIKAVAGGGGKGMRVARNSEELEMMFKMARREAEGIFNNSDVFIEKYVEDPHHIEFQILADMHGNVVHLFERECSIQRKHQKLVEEAPSPALNDQLRAKMGEAAVNITKYANYYSAGTVEFLVDSEKNFYFLEMNTRIQVEHPITEAITGVDLIEQMIRIAEGENLSFKQEDIKINGACVEYRLNAEDVQSNFAPAFGIIEQYDFPTHPNLRLDTGYKNGIVVPPYFDSMVAKVIVSAESRDKVLEISKDIFEDIKIKGIKTTLPFFKKVLDTPSFVKGSYTTSFLLKDVDQVYLQKPNEEMVAAYVAMQLYLNNKSDIETGDLEQKFTSPWLQSKYLKNF
ncbi:ATP-grasp domain-containing protein [Halosquirtibacter laminarini]|uniref:ATP-grasp domain-containing protein n=1 Tax=Halosquirtibacter laminarini TaxID=3374600 RepID=A0AC61NG38_9BACT|nr:ATP-grasp domain-containing protein [Prolixibacteraceae bacterium]